MIAETENGSSIIFVRITLTSAVCGGDMMNMTYLLRVRALEFEGRAKFSSQMLSRLCADPSSRTQVVLFCPNG